MTYKICTPKPLASTIAGEAKKTQSSNFSRTSIKSKTVILLFSFFMLLANSSFAGGGSAVVIEQELHIQTESNNLIAEVILFDGGGTPILSFPGNMLNEQIVEISTLLGGTYIVRVMTNNDEFFTTIIYHP